MTIDNSDPQMRDAFTFDVSCVVIAECELEAFGKLSRILSEVDHFWIDEGEPLDTEERERYLAQPGDDGTATTPAAVVAPH